MSSWCQQENRAICCDALDVNGLSVDIDGLCRGTVAVSLLALAPVLPAFFRRGLLPDSEGELRARGRKCTVGLFRSIIIADPASRAFAPPYFEYIIQIERCISPPYFRGIS